MKPRTEAYQCWYLIHGKNAGPNTNGSHFFVTLAPGPSLDGKHTIFGRVCNGMEIIKRLGSVQTDHTDR
uniref:Peptidyl-prolyl cis-trans isomerase n=1 Tax=Kalanchoe fedtschenkoi TaxID=63787 RepID=A0A7N0UAK3_KALFE